LQELKTEHMKKTMETTDMIQNNGYNNFNAYSRKDDVILYLR